MPLAFGNNARLLGRFWKGDKKDTTEYLMWRNPVIDRPALLSSGLSSGSWFSERSILL